MFHFVYWMKALAAILITNSHYADIWPVSRLALGGHLGNCIYFFVSGFCLYRVRDSFPRWYAKRILRIYPALWIVAAVNLLSAFWNADGFLAYVHCFLFPTWYHFIASIMLIYIAFYVVRTIQKHKRIETLWFGLLAFLVFFAAYLVRCDKTYYHIDAVEETWCRFQFMASMLVGAYMREKYEQIKPELSKVDIGGAAAAFLAYFAGKLLLTRYPNLSKFQILLPMIQVALIYFIGILFVKSEKRGLFIKAPAALRKIAAWIAGMSLEIYLVQGHIIEKLSKLPFPVNFFVVTGLILLAAYLVHRAADLIQRGCSRVLRLDGKKPEVHP